MSSDTDELIRLSEVPALVSRGLARPISQETVRGWAARGLGRTRIKLETRRIGGGVFTTPAEVEKFVARVNSPEYVNVTRRPYLVKAALKAPAAVEAPPGPVGDERVAVLFLKGSPDYREWLSRLSDESLIPVAAIVRDALGKWAQERGYPAPPER